MMEIYRVFLLINININPSYQNQKKCMQPEMFNVLDKYRRIEDTGYEEAPLFLEMKIFKLLQNFVLGMEHKDVETVWNTLTDLEPFLTTE